MVLAGDFEPAPGAVFALDAVVVADPTAGSSGELVDTMLRGNTLIGMQNAGDGVADELTVEIAEDAAETLAGVEDEAFSSEECEEFARRAQQRRKLFGRELLDADSRGLGWGMLRHGVAA